MDGNSEVWERRGCLRRFLVEEKPLGKGPREEGLERSDLGACIWEQG